MHGALLSSMEELHVMLGVPPGWKLQTFEEAEPSHTQCRAGLGTGG